MTKVGLLPPKNDQDSSELVPSRIKRQATQSLHVIIHIVNFVAKLKPPRRGEPEDQVTPSGQAEDVGLQDRSQV